MNLATILFLLCAGEKNELYCRQSYQACYDRILNDGNSEAYAIDACLVVKAKVCD